MTKAKDLVQTSSYGLLVVLIGASTLTGIFFGIFMSFLIGWRIGPRYGAFWLVFIVYLVGFLVSLLVFLVACMGVKRCNALSLRGKIAGGFLVLPMHILLLVLFVDVFAPLTDGFLLRLKRWNDHNNVQQWAMEMVRQHQEGTLKTDGKCGLVPIGDSQKIAPELLPDYIRNIGNLSPTFVCIHQKTVTLEWGAYILSIGPSQNRKRTSKTIHEVSPGIYLSVLTDLYEDY
jgi:hypothetical protein